ncbi:MAG TPA: hypothetical protein VNC16_07140 [Solirubrobacterales bacterium]|jgi:hypothetical protein|nr:hypothetical protein [Solirubrobacterales bacterium]
MLPFLLDLGFGVEAAAELLKRFRETLAYAQVSEGADTVSEIGEDLENRRVEGLEGSGDGREIMTPAALPPPTSNRGGPAEPEDPQRQQRTVQVTYSPTAWALVQAPFPLSEKDWNAMMSVLEGMKLGLVLPNEDE